MLLQQEEELQKRLEGAHYNEVVISTARWDPARWIQAVFYILPQSEDEEAACQGGEQCEKYARRLHSLYRQHFGRCSAQVPLLRLNRSNWDAPFEDVSVAT